MVIYPAIDLFEGKAVRLVRGDYQQMTVYNDDPVSVAREFKAAGAAALHVVDLEGARDGKPANFEVVKRIAAETELEIQTGGGVRTEDVIEKYIEIGVGRVILGTAAVSEPGFLKSMVHRHGDAIAVSADIRDGFVAIKGWMELSNLDVYDFCSDIEQIGVSTLICTDISKDGLLSGTNIELYRTLRERLSIKLIASGGITTEEDIRTLSMLGADGAILGKALYERSIDLQTALRAAARVPQSASEREVY